MAVIGSCETTVSTASITSSTPVTISTVESPRSARRIAREASAASAAQRRLGAAERAGARVAAGTAHRRRVNLSRWRPQRDRDAQSPDEAGQEQCADECRVEPDVVAGEEQEAVPETADRPERQAIENREGDRH